MIFDDDLDEPARVLPFAAFVQGHRNGQFHDELSSALRKLVHDCQLHDKPGELTIKVKLTPKGQMMIVTDTFAIKAPEPTRPESFYFTDQDFNLTRDNPQRELDFGSLREVPAAPAPVDGKSRAAGE